MDEQLTPVTPEDQAHSILIGAMTAVCTGCDEKCPVYPFKIKNFTTIGARLVLLNTPHCYRGDGGRNKYNYKLMPELRPRLMGGQVSREVMVIIDKILDPILKRKV